MIRYRVKNWGRFQHYKSRRPPWIKLHRTLLDDCIFLRLQTASRALAPLIWLLASESDDASVVGDHDELAFRLRIDRKEIDAGIKGLIASGYIERLHDASNALATRYQHATPETETETETETYKQETEKTIIQKPKTVFEPVDSNAKEGLLFEPGVQIPQDDEKDAGKGQETQMQGKPAKPRKAKKGKTDGEPKINAWKIWHDVCIDQGRKAPVYQNADGAAGKSIASSIGDVKKVEHVFRMYLQDRDKWLLERGHGLRYIGARINRYLNDSGGVWIPGEVWADDDEAEAIIAGKVETPF